MHLDLKKNIGNADRLLRIIVGIGLLTLVDINLVGGLWAKAAVVLSLLLFVESFLAY